MPRCCAMSSAVKPTTDLLRALPSVEKILQTPTMAPLLSRYRRAYLVDAVRAVLAQTRQAILGGKIRKPSDESDLSRRVAERVAQTDRSLLRTVVNATGTVLHTNLGRALLAQAAV